MLPLFKGHLLLWEFEDEAVSRSRKQELNQVAATHYD